LVAVRAVVLLLLLLRVFLSPLAAASPFDPTWIAGLWDGDDFDDIVTRIGLLASACDWSGPPLLGPDSAIADVSAPGPARIVGAHRVCRQGRAPPLA
jgi:hypothetical protein